MRKSLFVCCWPVWYVKWYSSTYRVSKQVLGKILSHVPKLIKVRLILIRWFSAIKPNFCELYNYNVAQWVPYPELVWTSCTHVMWYFLCISQSWKQNCAEVFTLVVEVSDNTIILNGVKMIDDFHLTPFLLQHVFLSKTMNIQCIIIFWYVKVDDDRQTCICQSRLLHVRIF